MFGVVWCRGGVRSYPPVKKILQWKSRSFSVRNWCIYKWWSFIPMSVCQSSLLQLSGYRLKNLACDRPYHCSSETSLAPERHSKQGKETTLTIRVQPQPKGCPSTAPPNPGSLDRKRNPLPIENGKTKSCETILWKCLSSYIRLEMKRLWGERSPETIQWTLVHTCPNRTRSTMLSMSIVACPHAVLVASSWRISTACATFGKQQKSKSYR